MVRRRDYILNEYSRITQRLKSYSNFPYNLRIYCIGNKMNAPKDYQIKDEIRYAAVTATGLLRMCNNKHCFRDILTGAGFSILSTRVSYWIYPIN